MFRGSYVVIAVLVTFFCALCITYSLAVTSHHVKPFLPYISYTGNQPLESCIFSLALSFCSALFILIVFLRYVQICNVIEKSDKDEGYLRKMEKINFLSVMLGVLGASGLSMTSSFQQRNFIFPHLVGVFFCICGTFAFFITQTFLTYKLDSHLTKRFVKTIRLIAVTGSGLIIVAGPIISAYRFIRHPHKLDWTSSTQREGDLNNYSAFLEWVLLILNFLFIASLYPDLTEVSLTNDQIIFLE